MRSAALPVGVFLAGEEGITWERWRHLAGLVERLGYSSLHRSDHVLSIEGEADRPALPAWPALTALAIWTSRVRFGPLVSPVTFHHPASLARAAVALDDLSGGRLVLGMGAGWYRREHRAFGIPFPPVGERLERLEESVQIVRALWSGRAVRFRGRHFALDGAVCALRPRHRPHPSVLIGGRSDGVLRIAARYADEWNVFQVPAPAYRERLEALRRYCADVPRDAAAIRRSWFGAVLVGEDAAAVACRARRMQEVIPRLRAVPPARLPQALRGEGWLVGTVREVVVQVQALVEAGVQSLIVQFHDLEDEAAMELVAREVVPQVRAEAAPPQPT